MRLEAKSGPRSAMATGVLLLRRNVCASIQWYNLDIKRKRKPEPEQRDGHFPGCSAKPTVC